MAPFRASRSTRSGRPTQDSDVMDGLPIRQWRVEASSVSTVPTTVEAPPVQDTIWKELIMPKDSHLYQPYMQQLLRKARAGQINASVRSSSANGSADEDKENGARDSAEDVAKAAASVAEMKGFMARKWSQIPRDMEGPEKEYLAKRRKGLPSPYAALNGPAAISGSGTHMRKTKVKKIDEQGNSYVLEVLVPEGQYVEGEIFGDLTLESAAAPISVPAPGTVVEGVGVANEEGVVIMTDAPIKRRPPPPRRKPKKIARSRKKVAFTGGDGVSASAEAFAAEANGAAPRPSIRIDGVDGQIVDDTTMGGTEEEEDEEEEEEEGEETDEEGEEGEEGDQDGNGGDGDVSISPQKNVVMDDAEIISSEAMILTGREDPPVHDTEILPEPPSLLPEAPQVVPSGLEEFPMTVSMPPVADLPDPVLLDQSDSPGQIPVLQPLPLPLPLPMPMPMPQDIPKLDFITTVDSQEEPRLMDGHQIQQPTVPAFETLEAPEARNPERFPDLHAAPPEPLPSLASGLPPDPPTGLPPGPPSELPPHLSPDLPPVSERPAEGVGLSATVLGPTVSEPSASLPAESAAESLDKTPLIPSSTSPKTQTPAPMEIKDLETSNASLEEKPSVDDNH